MNVTMEPVLTEKNDITPSQLGKTVLVELPLSTSYEQIGQTIWNLLHDEETDSQNEEQTASFQTLNANTVAYQLPSDDFVDRGDGHTDAYQIYLYKILRRKDMAEHRYGIRLKNKSPEASVLKILRRQFPELSIAELRSKITNHDYIYLSDMEKYDGEMRMAKLLCEYDKAGIETELFAEHRKDSSSWQTEPMSREYFYNILNSSQQTKREVSESIEYETEGFISPEAKCGEGKKKESVFGRLAGRLFSSKKGDRRNE